MAALFAADAVPERVLPANYNVAPTQEVYVVCESADRETGDVRRRLAIARWGLIPSWAKDPAIGNRMINARAETVADKPAYRSSFTNKRALVPADGFYEWQVPDRPGARKVPHYLRPADGSILAMAGLYAWWRDPRVADAHDPSAWVMSTTILTFPATGDVAAIHDRSPVPVAPQLWSAWLDPAIPGEQVLPGVLAAAAAVSWDIHPVSPAVNNPRTNIPDLMSPVRD